MLPSLPMRLTFTSDKYNKMIAETLSKYQGYSDRINVTYFDTTKDPDVLSKYQELYGGSIQSGQVIINRRQAYQGVQHPDRYV